MNNNHSNANSHCEIGLQPEVWNEGLQPMFSPPPMSVGKGKRHISPDLLHKMSYQSNLKNTNCNELKALYDFLTQEEAKL